MDKRYFIKQPVQSVMTNVMDTHFPDFVIAYCTDEMKAELICHLLNESWNKASNRGPAHD